VPPAWPALQAAWRGRQARLQLRRLRAAVVLQSVWRGRAARTLLAARRSAAIAIQAHWRRASQRMRYARAVAAVVKVLEQKVPSFVRGKPEGS
jgi:IQ calmodulin-binding motif